MDYSHIYGFEKLDVWKKARELTGDIYACLRKFPKAEEYGLSSQLKRATISVCNNIAEGNGRISGKEQARFSEIAYSSNLEVLNLLLIANDLGFINKSELNTFREKINYISHALNKLRRYQLSKIKEPEENYIHLPPQHSHPSPLSQHSSPPFFSHPSSIIDKGAQIGKGSKIWHFSHVMKGSSIGENCNIGQNVFIASGVVLGRNVKVQNNVSVYDGVICEEDVFLGPSMVFTNVVNPRSAVNRKHEYKKTHVQKGVTIGANATILCGITIGRYAFIGAGAVVAKGVLPYALIIGNPGQQIGWMSEYGHRLKFNTENVAECPEKKEKYRLENGEVIKL